MYKKFISFVVILCLIVNNFMFFKSYASDTNGLNNPWTYEKASHLARKTLFGVDGDKVKKLLETGSAEAAVNSLFPSVQGPDRTDFQNKLNSIISGTGFNITNGDNMKSYYLQKNGYDPYQAKAKLFTLFEDIFSVYVNSTQDITYIDIENNHDMLYKYTLGSYKDMIKRNLYNNGEAGDYALGKFLDLFNQKTPNSPNENYAREIMQLFLMLEYIPGKSAENGDSRNYSEEDVNALAKILVGFESDENTHKITYNNAINTNQKIKFLDGNLKAGDSFPFYDANTGEIDVQLLKNPIGGNNGLADNIIDYIFSKREYAISMFLANRLYKFYVDENPSNSNLTLISNKLLGNNFDIYTTVKWLLASDMMYSEKSMNSIIYKNPLELTLGTANIFGINFENLRVSSVVNLGWNPYYPASIFGRDGFDDNGAFYTAYTETQWVNEASYIINSLDTTKLIPDKIYLTPYAGDDKEFQNILYSNKSELLNLKTGTGSGLSGVVNLINFNIKETNNNPIIINTGSVDFNDFSISISNNEKIEITNGKLDYKNSKINIISGTYIKDGISKNIYGTAEIDGFYLIQKDFTNEGLVTYLEDKLYLDRKLPIDIKNKLIKFISFDDKGVPVTMNLTNYNYKNYYIKGLVNLMLAQPEYVMQSGYDLAEDVNNTLNTNFINNNSKLIIIKASGGLDYLHAVIPKDEYSEYMNNRGTGALVGNEILSLDDDYYINAKLEPFKQLYDSGNLKLINRVGTPDNSRGHDTASQKITSVDNSSDILDDGIIGNFIKDEDYTKTIVMGGYNPLIFRGGNYLNIGTNAYFNMYDSTNAAFRIHKRDLLKDILDNRTYPGNAKNVFKNAVTISNVALNSYNAGGKPGSGYNMTDNFIFLESIFDSNISSIARMGADGGYDTHGNQKQGLSDNLEKVAQRTADYFNRVKDKQDVTIVIFSEFGRTLKMTGSMGTDHGKGGGMFIISNNKDVLQNLDKKVYGNLSFKNGYENWLGVGIDYRAVYYSLMKYIYKQDISAKLGAVYDINNYIDTTGPKVELLNKEFENISTTRTKIRFKFKLDDTNFKPDQASYVKIQYGKDVNNLYNESQYNISRYMSIGENAINLYLNNIESKTNYFYKVTIYDNQYNTTVLEGSFVSPEIKNNTDIVSLNTDTRLMKYNNTNIGLNFNLETNTSSGILLGSTTQDSEIMGENGLILKTNSGTYVTNLSSSSTGTIWNGGFTVPYEINKDFFISKTSKYNGNLLSNLNIDKIIKVGADKLDIAMNLNQDAIIKIPNLDTNKKYSVIYSQDGENWNKVSDTNVVKTGTNLDLKVNHFTYFALVEVDNTGKVIVNIPIDTGNSSSSSSSGGSSSSSTSSSSSGGSSSSSSSSSGGSSTSSSSSSSSSGGGGSILRQDVCKYGDFSPSYYDNSCGVDPDEKLSKMGLGETDVYRLEQNIEKERELTEQKDMLYNNIIKSSPEIQNKDSIISTLLDKISYIQLGNFKLTNIKGSGINESVKKIGEFIISQNFSIASTQLLIDNLNDLVVYVSMYKVGNLDADTKALVLKKINETVRDFSTNFKNSRKKIKKVVNNDNKTPNNNIVVNTNNTNTIKNTTKETAVVVQSETKLKSLQFRVNIENIYLKADPYWVNNVGILEKGDIVEQITQIHEKGFFMIKVIKAKNLKEGTTGYIFSKYLSK
ncbi:MAG: DUF1800 family protein [Candidatus Gracilibacteria bacterium]|nr:DUF1800 family protein [Candidatus Gracilibacteria bacterium]